MQESLDYHYTFKYIVVGDSSVGKTSILANYHHKKINDESNPTMGVEYSSKKIEVHGNSIKLQIWDTAGQESFRTITRSYYKNAIGVILVYDLTNRSSIVSLSSWLDEIEENSSEQVQIIVVGNKSDLYKGKNKILPERLQRFPSVISSAVTGSNIDKIFRELTEKVLLGIQTGEIKTQGNPGIKKGSTDKKISLSKTEQQQNGKKGSPCC